MVAELRGLGVTEGDIVMVHAAVRKVGPIIGGVNALMQSLLGAVGIGGTLVAYVDWEMGFDPDAIDAALLDEIPVFDKRIARAARDYGILPEVIRTWPGAIRSDNPEAGIAAVGARAEWLCADHALSYGYGAESPYAKLITAGAKILVLGAPLDTMTLLHHAEHVARLEGKRIRRYRHRFPSGSESYWLDIEEFDTSDPVVDGMPDDHFTQIAVRALDAAAGRHGSIGAADAYLFDARALHRAAVDWLEAWRP